MSINTSKPLFLLPRPEDADPALAEAITALGFTVLAEPLFTARYFPVPPEALATATHLVVTSRRGLKTLPRNALPLLSVGAPPEGNVIASAATAKDLQAHLDTLPADARPLYLRGTTIRRALHHPGLIEAIVYDVQATPALSVSTMEALSTPALWGIGFLSPRLATVFLELAPRVPSSPCFCLSPAIADVLRSVSESIIIAKTPSAAGLLAAIIEKL